MSETWYRGQSSAAGQTSGAAVGGHDLGDGVYYTNDAKVAGEYADIRVARSGGERQVVQVTVDRAALGRVLDLTQDPRWRKFLETPQIPGMANTTPRALIKLANQNYPNLFTTFVREHRIAIAQYDAVIAEEFVRGGNQLCIRNVNGQPSAIAKGLQARWAPLGGEAPVARMEVTLTRITFRPASSGGPGAFQTYWRERETRLANNQAGWAVFGVMLGGAIQSVGDIGIQRRAQSELEKRGDEIRAVHAKGMGVMAIIRTMEWETPDFNGMRARSFVSVILQPGLTPEDAMNRWTSQQNLVADAPKGWRMRTPEYLWIE